MVMLRERSRRSIWEDWRKDHWLAQSAFGLFLTALAVGLVVLSRGVPFGD